MIQFMIPYRFPFTYKTIKSSIKNSTSKLLASYSSTKEGLAHIRESIKKKNEQRPIIMSLTNT
jgi:hypothetical protein